ncbi:hypothetical protein D3C81_1781530 [compost metagenome]
MGKLRAARDAKMIGAIDGGTGENEACRRGNDCFFHLRSLMAGPVCAVGSGIRKARSAQSFAVLASNASRSTAMSMVRWLASATASSDPALAR